MAAELADLRHLLVGQVPDANAAVVASREELGTTDGQGYAYCEVPW